MDVTIIDDFLPQVDFLTLKTQVYAEEFPWFFSPYVSSKDVEILPTPGMFKHMVYLDGTPMSQIYADYFRIFHKALDISILFRIRINFNLRLQQPYSSVFHVDEEPREERRGVWILPTGNKYVPKYKDSEWATSIFYINTNNGYTELEDGTIIESIANRTVTFPLSTKHRMVTQTDTQTRHVINFSYLKTPERVIKEREVYGTESRTIRETQ